MMLMFILSFMYLITVSVQADYFTFNLNDRGTSATLTAIQDGRTIWTYDSGYVGPNSELGNFSHVILNNDSSNTSRDNRVYLVQAGTILCFDMLTGEILWKNADFGGMPADGCWTFSSSGKLYIGGYYVPDLFVVDTDGTTKCRISSIASSDYYWPYEMWFDHGDYLSIRYYSNEKVYTFDVMNYLGRIERSY